MKKLLTVLFWGIVSFQSFAQNKPLYTASQVRRIQNISQEVSDLQSINYQKALVLAKQKGWKLREQLENNQVKMLQGVDANNEPLYLITDSNTQAGIATGASALYAGGFLGLNFSGNSPGINGKLGIWDGGGISVAHQEFGNRVTQQDKPASIDLHGTHVAGTMVAAGVSPQAKGMAFGASLKAWDFNSDVSEMSAAAKDLILSNHSYGFLAGWYYTGTRWQWYGSDAVSTEEDYKFGFYDSSCQSYDKIAYNAPYYLIVKSAGNNRGENGPPAGQLYYLRGTGDTSRVARNKNDAKGGYDLLSTTSNAKNILTIGAVNPLVSAPNQPANITISSFSSWGPTDDGRIKPDIVGVGVNMFSTTNVSTTSYTNLSGTSMSSPQVCGSLFLLQELYGQQNDNIFMKAATLKALALHTATDAGNPGPDYIYGWGLINTEKAAQVILNNDKTHSLTERNILSGATFTQNLVASGKGSLRVTIAWADPVATPSDLSNSLNNRTPKLINDLDIRISDGTTTTLPWVLDPEQPSKNATQGDNIRDNVEQILIPNAVPGKTYTLTITSKGTLSGTSGQDYALIISGIGGKTYCSSKATNDADARIEKVVFGNISKTSDNTCASRTDNTNLNQEISAGQQIPLEISLGTCGQNLPKIVKVFIDWNTDGDFDDANELVATSSVINGTETFQTTIKSPSGLVVGNSAVMRIVCTETSTASDVKSCGDYAKGETEEYKISFVLPATDVGATALLSPENVTFCSGNIKEASVKIKNFGTKFQVNIPVNVKVFKGTELVGILSETLKDTLDPFEEVQLFTKGNIPTLSNQEYRFEITTNLPNDQDSLNNAKSFIRKIADIVLPKIEGTLCGETATTVNLKSDLSNVLWYDAPMGGNLLTTGNKSGLSVPKPAAGQKVFAALNDFSGSFAPKDKYAFGGGSYFELFGPEPLITTQVPLVIESARLYIGSAGKVTVSVSEVSSGKVISSITFNVKATRNTSTTTRVNGQIADDLQDSGIEVPLNLAIPVAGNYKISQLCEDGASLFRSNLNAGTATGGVDLKGYPFNIPNVISLTGALFSGSPIKTGYYYFYDLKVKSYGCPSPRTELPIATETTPTLTLNPSTEITFCEGNSRTISAESSDKSATFQWFLNGQRIDGKTTNSLIINTKGTYLLESISSTACKLSTKKSIVATTTSGGNPPTVSITPNSELPFCDGTEKILSATISDANATLQWYLNNEKIVGQTTKDLTVKKAGIYTLEASTTAECKSIGKQNVTAKVLPTPNPIISINGTILTVSTLADTIVSNIQWLLGNQPIPSENKRTYLAVQTGNYAVRVDNKNGCTGVSNSIAVTILGNEEPADQSIKVFPNPSNRILRIEYFTETPQKPAQATLLNILGVMQGRYNLVSDKQKMVLDLDVTNYPSGRYLLNVTQEGKSKAVIFVKE